MSTNTAILDQSVWYPECNDWWTNRSRNESGLIEYGWEQIQSWQEVCRNCTIAGAPCSGGALDGSSPSRHSFMVDWYGVLSDAIGMLRGEPSHDVETPRCMGPFYELTSCSILLLWRTRMTEFPHGVYTPSKFCIQLDHWTLLLLYNHIYPVIEIVTWYRSRAYRCIMTRAP